MHVLLLVIHKLYFEHLLRCVLQIGYGVQVEVPHYHVPRCARPRLPGPHDVRVTHEVPVQERVHEVGYIAFIPRVIIVLSQTNGGVLRRDSFSVVHLCV